MTVARIGFSSFFSPELPTFKVRVEQNALTILEDPSFNAAQISTIKFVSLAYCSPTPSNGNPPENLVG